MRLTWRLGVDNLFDKFYWRDVTQDAEEYVRYVRSLGEPHKTQAFTVMKGPLLQLIALVELRAWEHTQIGPDEWMQGSEQGFDDIVGAAQAERHPASIR